LAWIAEIPWRLLPAVRRRERSRFLFFSSLWGILQLGLTLGLAGSEGLFLARIGAERLPETFVLASLSTVLLSFAYAALVGRARNDALLVWMLAALGALLAAATALAWQGSLPALPALLCAYYVSLAVLTNHFFSFAGDYFDTLAAKRIVPLLHVGGSLGGFAGGTLGAWLGQLAPELLLVGWAGAFAGAAGLVLGASRWLRRVGPLELDEADETSVEGVRGALRYVRGSPFGRWLVVSALTMVLALFSVQYLYSRVFAERFPDARQLTVFLGGFLAVTNLIEIAVAVGVTPWLVRRYGVPTASLVHPALTIAAFGALAAQFALPAALFARATRELFENALGSPLRTLVYNGLPLRFRGRVRAFLEGIVVYAGMSVAGAFVLAARDVPVGWLCSAGAGFAALYLLADLRVRREYLGSIVTELRRGRLDLSEVRGEIGEWEVSRLGELWDGLLNEEPLHPQPAVLAIAPVLAERGLADPLRRGAAHENPAVRAACIRAMAEWLPREAEPVVARALCDADASVRLAALTASGCLEETPRLAEAKSARLEDEDPCVRAESAARAGEAGAGVLRAMLASAETPVVLAALRTLPAPLREEAVRRLDSANPAIVAAALEALARLGPVDVDAQALERCLAHPDSGLRRAAVRALATRSGPGAASRLLALLDDLAPEVSHAAEQALLAIGEAARDLASAELESEAPFPLRRRAALLRLATHPDPEACRPLLRRVLARSATQAIRSRRALRLLPPDGTPAERFLGVAHADAVASETRFAFRVLEKLEEPSVVRGIERVLRFGGARARADALEVLSHLGEREAAHDLVSLLEDPEGRGLPARVPAEGPDRGALHRAAAASRHPWLRLAGGALGAAESGIPIPPDEEALMDRLIALRRIPLFAKLSLDQLDAVNRITSEVDFVAGEVVMREGEAGGELYLVVEGALEARHHYGEADDTLLTRLQPGDYFGEMAILDDAPRSATVVVTQDARLLTLAGTRLKELILEQPEIAFEIFRVLTARIRQAEQRIADLREKVRSPGGDASGAS
jgi:HEAT repeat protein